MNVVGGGSDGIALKDTLRLSFGKIHLLLSHLLYNLLRLPPLSLSLQVLLSTIELQACTHFKYAVILFVLSYQQ